MLNVVAAVQMMVAFEDGAQQTFSVSPDGIVERVTGERWHAETRQEAVDAIRDLLK